MKYLKKMIPIVIVLICMFNIVYFTLITETTIVLNKVTPDKITANEKFFAENGKSTMGVYGEEFEMGDIIFLNNEPQETAFGNEGWMTCFVDHKYYEEEGSIIVQVKRIDILGKVIEKSNKFKIVVK